MEFHDAMRKAVREYGVRVIAEKRLIFILADLKAFEEYPAVKPVLEAVVSGGAGRELVRLFLEEDRDWFLSYAGNLKKSLSGKNHFRQDLADYAADSILYGLGLTDTVTEPSDHGFDPAEHGSGAGNSGAGERKARSEEEVKDRVEENAGGGAKEWGAGVTRREPSAEKEKETEVSTPGIFRGGSAAPRNAGAKSTSSSLKWMIAAVLLAGGFAWGSLVTGSSHEQEQAAASRTAESSEAVKDDGHAPGAHGNGKNSYDANGDGEALGASDRRAAESHDGEYEYKEGEKHYYRGDARNYAEALRWYLKAADKGNAGAEYRLGWMYELGTGVAQNYEMALGWYRKALAHGNQDATARIERLEKKISVRAKGGGSLTIWVNGDKSYNGIAKVGKRFTSDTGVKVTVAHPDQADARFQEEAQRGKGPDIFLWGHDRFGEWARAGLLAPLNPSSEERARFTGFAWDAMTVGGKVYGYPFSLEAISLLCNRKLVPNAPENWEDFIVLDNKLREAGARAIYWDYTTPYYTYGLISANGGYAYKKSADGFYDVGETGVADEEAKMGVRFLVDLVRNGHMKRGADYSVMESDFSKGRLGCILNGPWSWSNYDRAGINFSVNRLPKLSGRRSRPFVGVQGFVVSAVSHNKDLAVYFLENYLLTNEGLMDVNNDKAIGVSALKSFEAQIGRDERIAGTMENAEGGDLIPSVPEMSRFWTYFQTALKNAVAGRQSVDDALETAAKRIAQ